LTVLSHEYTIRIVVTGSQLRAIRRELGLTQAALAEAVGVRPNTVARWERGELGISKPMARLVEKIAAELASAKREKFDGVAGKD
jgi:transcriptional regulator with XRE-family HTH domain